MATNPPGKGKAVVACSVPEAVAAEIIRRAKSLNWTKSKYAGLLLERWYNTGAEQVSPLEQALVYQQNFEQQQAVAEDPPKPEKPKFARGRMPRGPSQENAG